MVDKSINTVKYKKIYWSDIENPNIEIINSIGKRHKFHELDMEDILSEDQRSKIDDYEKYVFMVLHFPIFDKKSATVKTLEIDIFVTQKYVISFHKDQIKVVNDLLRELKSPKSKKDFMSKGSVYFLYELLSRIFENSFSVIDEIEQSLNEIEKDVLDVDSEEKDKLKDILLAKKNINVFRRAIGPQRPVIASLEHKTKKFASEDFDIYFDDIVDMMEKIWNNIEELRELAGFLQDTNESALTHRTNQTIKILTALTIVTLPLVIIPTFYGMNVGLPHSDNMEAFWYITFFTFVLSIITWLVLKLKKLV